jgi:hypothetical protein
VDESEAGRHLSPQRGGNRVERAKTLVWCSESAPNADNGSEMTDGRRIQKCAR